MAFGNVISLVRRIWEPTGESPSLEYATAQKMLPAKLEIEVRDFSAPTLKSACPNRWLPQLELSLARWNENSTPCHESVGSLVLFNSLEALVSFRRSESPGVVGLRTPIVPEEGWTWGPKTKAKLARTLNLREDSLAGLCQATIQVEELKN